MQYVGQKKCIFLEKKIKNRAGTSSAASYHQKLNQLSQLILRKHTDILYIFITRKAPAATKGNICA